MGVELRKQRLDGGRVVLWVCGELDLSTRDEIGHSVRDILGVPDVAAIVIDLSGTRFLDASGIGGLMRAHTLAQRANVRLVVQGSRGMVDRVLRITRAGDVLCSPAVPMGEPEPD